MRRRENSQLEFHPRPLRRRLAGHTVQTLLNRPFSEATAMKSDLQINPGHELMEYFLRV